MNHPDFDAYTKDLRELIRYGPEAIASFHCYAFEWIDNLHFLQPLYLIITNRARLDPVEDTVMRRLKNEGWDGTGRLAFLWLPPFVFPNPAPDDTDGVIVWHVKQQEDGISWLLSPVPLPFPAFGG